MEGKTGEHNITWSQQSGEIPDEEGMEKMVSEWKKRGTENHLIIPKSLMNLKNTMNPQITKGRIEQIKQGRRKKSKRTE